MRRIVSKDFIHNVWYLQSRIITIENFSRKLSRFISKFRVTSQYYDIILQAIGIFGRQKTNKSMLCADITNEFQALYGLEFLFVYSFVR